MISSTVILRCPKPLILNTRVISCNGSYRYYSTPVRKQLQGIFKRSMQAYENYLEKKWPKVYKIHRMVVDGCKACVADVKTYYYIRKDLNSGKVSLTDLSRPQLETYIQTRQELGKVSGIVIITPLPFALYVFAIAIIFFPRYVLTRHFWSKEQKKKFWIDSIKKAADRHYLPLIEKLPQQPKTIEFPLHLKEVKDVKVTAIDNLDLYQMYHLSRVHRFLPINGISNLRWRADALKHLDLVMLKDLSSLDTMSSEELYTQMFIRCLNFENLSDDEMKKILRTWIENSNEIASNASLYLHTPVLNQFDKQKALTDASSKQ